MAKEQSYRERLGSYQWRVYIFEDYNDKESVMVYKCHHSLMDGLSCILMYMNMCDKPDLTDVPPIMMRFNPLQQFLQLLIVPFYVLFLTFKLLLCMENQNNGLNTREIRNNLDALKTTTLAHDIKIDILKKRSKELGCSLNDIIMTCISRMFK